MEKFNFLVSVFVVAISLISCSSDNKANKNLELIDQYVQAVEAKDLVAMASLLHENYKGFGPSINDSIDKSGAMENWTYLAEEYYDQIKYDDFLNIAQTIKDGPYQGDWVSNWAILDLKFKDGRGPVKLYVNVVYKIKDDQIIHSRTFYNEADVLNQLGYEY